MTAKRPGPSGLRLLTIRPLADFLGTEAGGGVVLLIATLGALVWANSPWGDSYQTLWSTELTISLGNHSLSLDLQHWVNDGLMTVFFFVVGLEIKRELVTGELREPRRAALPAMAALGGMAVPALLYVAINAGGDGSAGWGIPMATDIAMAIGIMSLVGSRVSSSLKLFLLALAIVDDIGAIVVIAIFYSKGVSFGWLGIAIALLGVAVVLRVSGVNTISIYVLVGIAIWFATHESGVHATLAGVVLGLLTPTSAAIQRDIVDADDLSAELSDVSSVEAAVTTADLARSSVSVVEWLEHKLHPLSSYVIVPVFALANAGVVIDPDTVADAANSPVTLGVIVGLVVGKPLGIISFAWAATKSRLATLPTDASWAGITAVSVLAGIGFTVSLFVTSLAFDSATLATDAKIGILAASFIAAVAGSLLLTRLRRPLAVET